MDSANLEHFIERKITHSGEIKTFECSLLSKTIDGELVILYEPKEVMHFAGITFDKGSRSFGYYWENRNYNVYHWIGTNGETIAFYFNISRDTSIEKSEVSWVDLIVDVLLVPGHPLKVLDEDEIPKNIATSDLELIYKSKSEILANLDEMTKYLERRTLELIKEELSQPK